jgi:hypothetical protein
MADLPTAIRNRLVDYLRGAGAPTAIAGLFLDISVGGSFGAAANGLSANTAAITVTNGATGGGTITHFAFFDAATGGNLVGSHVLTTGNMVVNTGNAIKVDIGGVSLSIT